MKKRKYGVLIHGAGWVSTQHIAAFQANPATEIVAISSRKLDSAHKRAADAGLSGVGLYDDLDQALKHPGVDIVSICTPQHVHCDNVLAAARAGKHLVIEKPAGISMAELRRMQQAVARARVKTVVSFVLRWNPLFQKLKSMLAAGTLGKPYCIEADYLSHNAAWWSGWDDTRTTAHGVSAMLVAGCHAIDALRWFASTSEFEAATPVEVVSVSGGYRKGQTRAYHPGTHGWMEPTTPMEYDGLEIALVKFDNGVTGKVSVNFDCVMPYRFPIRIFGDRGSVIDNRVWLPEARGPKKWRELKAIQPDSSDVSHHPFQAQMDHFIGCLQQDVESHCNLADAIQTHAVAFAALQSSRTGRAIRLPHTG